MIGSSPPWRRKRASSADGGRAVDVVVAEDRDLLAARDRVGDARRRLLHAGERVRIGHQPPHGRIEESLDLVDLDAAAGEDARQQFRHAVALRDRERARRRRARRAGRARRGRVAERSTPRNSRVDVFGASAKAAIMRTPTDSRSQRSMAACDRYGVAPNVGYPQKSLRYWMNRSAPRACRRAHARWHWSSWVSQWTRLAPAARASFSTASISARPSPSLRASSAPRTDPADSSSRRSSSTSGERCNARCR